MYGTEYCIARISIRIIAPTELTDDEGFRQYRVKPEEAFDTGSRYEIELLETEEMPEPKGQCLFQNDLNLIFDQQPPLHCFRIPGRKKICEWDLLEQEQKKEGQEVSHKVLHVLPEASGYFRNSIGVFNAVGFERILYQFKKFLFHCSYVDYKGKAVLFSAPSGGGKTTQGKLWEEYAGAAMINGDRAVIERTEAGVICHGLPIAGSSGVFINRSLPLTAIFTLEKASENKVVRLKGKDAVYAIFSQLTVNMWDEAFVGDALDSAIAVAQNVPVYRLSCTISKEAVDAAKIQVEKIIGE